MNKSGPNPAVCQRYRVSYHRNPVFASSYRNKAGYTERNHNRAAGTFARRIPEPAQRIKKSTWMNNAFTVLY
ncbi:hypothetical protein ACQKL5_07700 [Peribacillus sp. NPDC097675]|uniref:hypothetical protein n=1 Tax=Peribacillus sp. NPDC097675 TaxID=3390618 RepID=UPI003D0628C0